MTYKSIVLFLVAIVVGTVTLMSCGRALVGQAKYIDGKEYIYDKNMFTLKGHEGVVWSAAYSPDGARIVTGGIDKTAKVWDADTGKELLTLTGHEGYVLSAVYSPDGKRIATAGMDGIVQIYTTDMDELLQIAESRVTRQLTAEEKEKYGVLDLN